MGFFDRDPFDLNRDGKIDAFEEDIELQMMAGSREEAIALTGDDTFYIGSDDLEEDDELVDECRTWGELNPATRTVPSGKVGWCFALDSWVYYQ